MHGQPPFRAIVASTLSLFVFGIAVAARAQTPAVPWPHTLTINGAQVVVYQPQAIEWPDHQTLTTREAIAITQPGDKTPVLGTTEISFATHTDAATGEVFLSDPKLLTSHFPALDTERAARIEQQIKTSLPEVHPAPVPLEAVLLSLRQTSKPDNVALNNDPPVIFYSAKPASLVVLDGDPVTALVGNTGLSFVVNTNWELFTDGSDWYLLNNGVWLMAGAFSGPYQPVSKLPPAFSAIPAEANFAAVRKAIRVRHTPRSAWPGPSSALPGAAPGPAAGPAAPGSCQEPRPAAVQADPRDIADLRRQYLVRGD